MAVAMPIISFTDVHSSKSLHTLWRIKNIIIRNKQTNTPAIYASFMISKIL